MKAIRFTHFISGGEPATIVVTERDLAVSVDEAITQMLDVPGEDHRYFTAWEVFEVTSFEEAVIEGAQRAAERAERESNMAILYGWDAAQLSRITPGGLLSTKSPSPLNREEVVMVLSQLKRHPNYDNQTVIVHTERGDLVQLYRGEVQP